MSIALKHKRKMQSKASPADIERISITSVAPNASSVKEFASLKESLPADLITLKHANGDAERHPFKKELIEKYKAYAQAMMKYDNWAGQKVIFYWLLWRLDIEGFEAVEPLFYKAIQHGLTTPDEFKRDWQTIYLDTVYIYSNKAFKEEKEFVTEYLLRAVTDLTEGKVVTNTPLKSKLFALMGKVAYRFNDPKLAIKYFEKALSLDDGAGVKKLLKQAKEQLATELESEESTNE